MSDCHGKAHKTKGTYTKGRKFESPHGDITSVEFDHEIISTVILPLPLIQNGQFS